MHFSLPNLADKARYALRRLNIGFHCAICGRFSDKNRDLCHACESLLVQRVQRISPSSYSFLCLLCGDDVLRQFPESPSRENLVRKYSSLEKDYCSGCSKVCNIFTKVIAPYRYDFPMDRIIGQMKYGNAPKNGRLLGELLASHVSELPALPELLIPVPLHRNRLAQRGYNQAADIAKWCAAQLNIQSCPSFVVRTADTRSLAGLSRAERQLQILGAFRASERVFNRHVAIVDDVLTTGATTREMARELYDAGASSVELWVLARTSSDR